MSRFYFEFSQPSGTMSLDNLRNNLRALHELDMLSLRPRAKGTPTKAIQVSGSQPGSFYANVYFGSTPLNFATGDSPLLTNPASNPRIDILAVDALGTLSWVSGDEASSPVPKWANLSPHKMPLALVYCKSTMTKVVNYEDAAANPNEGYIYADIRPFLTHSRMNLITNSSGDTYVDAEVVANQKSLRFYANSSEKMQVSGDVIKILDQLNVTDELACAGVVGTSGDALITQGTGKTPRWGTVSGVPTGCILPFAGSTAPAGYLLCDGSAVSRTTYASLFAVISTAFGAGDGSTTFNVPDLRGRVPLGKDNMGGVSANRVTATEADTLGQSSGTETHTLTTSEMPSHTHNITVRDSSGTQTAKGADTGGSSGTAVTASAGSGSAHNNMQPYITVNYVVKT